MIQADIDRHNNTGQIVLSPTTSASWRTNLLFIYAVAATALSSAIFFALQGAWLILPFAGLEVLALFGVVYYWYRHHSRKEVLRFTTEEVTVEKGIKQPEERRVYQKFLARAHVRQPRHPWYPTAVSIRCRNEEIRIGEFLTEDETKELITCLRQVITVV
jgi:uncharacterized membrane protein